jgi:type IV secretory pathway TrbD component
MDAPRETPIFASGVRSQIWLGADRGLMIAIFTLTALLVMIALVAPLWWLLALAFVFMVGSVKLVRGAHKDDPLLIKAYLRAVRYLDFYPAKSGLYARVRRAPKGWVGFV